MMHAKNIAEGGLLSALAFIFLLLTYVIPTNTLTLLTLAAFTVPLSLIRCNMRVAVSVYTTSTLLSLCFLPLSITLMYGLFFGSYGIVKYWIERINRPLIEWFFKFVFFNSVFLIGLTTFIELISPAFLLQLDHLFNYFLPRVSNSAFWALWAFAQIAFVIFDYALMLLIDTYYNYFRRGTL